MALTNKEKQAQFKERMRKQGFQLVALWVHQDDKAKLKQIAKDMEEKRKS